MYSPTFQDGYKIVGGQRIPPARVKQTKSSNRMTIYTTILWEDGTYSCDCPGWCVAKAGKERTCKHVRLSERRHGQDMDPAEVQLNARPVPAVTATREVPQAPAVSVVRRPLGRRRILSS